MNCLWCKEELVYAEGKGWVHQDGQIYEQKYDPELGQIVDDHCAVPDHSRQRTMEEWWNQRN